MKDYRSSHRVQYEEPKRRGYTVLPVLRFLWGQPWDQLALNFVHSLRPDSIRVVMPGHPTTLDAIHWRVTVHMLRDDMIERIEQEVEVGLDESYYHGHALMCEARKRGLL